MGCDYYHEAARDDVEDASDEPGKLELTVRVYDGNNNTTVEKQVTVEIPVGGKAYIDRNPQRPPIWAR